MVQMASGAHIWKHLKNFLEHLWTFKNILKLNFFQQIILSLLPITFVPTRVVCFSQIFTSRPLFLLLFSFVLHVVLFYFPFLKCLSAFSFSSLFFYIFLFLFLSLPCFHVFSSKGTEYTPSPGWGVCSSKWRCFLDKLSDLAPEVI